MVRQYPAHMRQLGGFLDKIGVAQKQLHADLQEAGVEVNASNFGAYVRGKYLFPSDILDTFIQVLHDKYGLTDAEGDQIKRDFADRRKSTAAGRRVWTQTGEATRSPRETASVEVRQVGNDARQIADLRQRIIEAFRPHHGGAKMNVPDFFSTLRRQYQENGEHRIRVINQIYDALGIENASLQEEQSIVGALWSGRHDAPQVTEPVPRRTKDGTRPAPDLSGILVENLGSDKTIGM